jgi:hypothetical protein
MSELSALEAGKIPTHNWSVDQVIKRGPFLFGSNEGQMTQQSQRA